MTSLEIDNRHMVQPGPITGRAPQHLIWLQEVVVVPHLDRESAFTGNACHKLVGPIKLRVRGGLKSR